MIWMELQILKKKTKIQVNLYCNKQSIMWISPYHELNATINYVRLIKCMRKFVVVLPYYNRN